jgi:glutamate 5-kinase
MGYPRPLTAPQWGFEAVYMGGRPVRLDHVPGTRVMDELIFKLHPAQRNAATAVEGALQLHAWLDGRTAQVHEVRVFTQWIAGSLQPSGAITIDAGALQALRTGKSLLPAGVTAVSGRFSRGDTVSVLDRDGNEIARGMIAFSERDAARIIGKRSADIEAVLGFRGRTEMIHRDDLVLMRADVATVI